MDHMIRIDRNTGDHLKRLRENANLSQEKLCAKLRRHRCGIGRTTYAKYEAGELNLHTSGIIELRKTCKCEYDDYFYGLDTSDN